MTRRPVVAVAVLSCALTGCVLTGCVTPASSTPVYEAKAALTAEDALSSARTAVLAARTHADGDLPGPYLETILVDAETSFGAVQATFDSLQPPATPRADELRTTLDQLLQDGGGTLTELRIAFRDGREGDVANRSDELAAVADRLESFAEAHSS